MRPAAMQKIETDISELLNRQPVTEQEKDDYIRELQKATGFFWNRSGIWKRWLSCCERS